MFRAQSTNIKSTAGETVSVTLNPGAPNISSEEDPFEIGSGGSPTWTASGVTGMFQHGAAIAPVFVPLYGVKEIKKRAGRRRQSPDPSDDEKEE